MLLVEDHAESAEGLAELLGLWGYETQVAEDGEGALEAVAQSLPEVVITDIGLPGMDGHELARRLRRMPGGGDVTIIALTGFGAEILADTTESGFDHRLVKPVDLDALERLLERRRTPS